MKEKIVCGIIAFSFFFPEVVFATHEEIAPKSNVGFLFEKIGAFFTLGAVNDAPQEIIKTMPREKASSAKKEAPTEKSGVLKKKVEKKKMKVKTPPRKMPERKSIPQKQQKTKARTQKQEKGAAESKKGTVNLQEQFTALEQELAEGKAKGLMLEPAHYERIIKDLNALLEKGYQKNEIEQLRAIAVKLAPHIKDEERKREPQTVKASGEANASCANDTKPILTADITDFSKIKKITAPGSPSSEGPKGHSFVGTDHAYVPVYLPVAATLDSGSYSKNNAESPAQYLLFFKTKDNCNYQVKFDHIDEPIDAIKTKLPKTPSVSDSRTREAAEKLEFKAGDLIGYTSGTRQAGNWDFGLYDTSKDGALAQHGSSGMHTHAVCWVDFYTPEKQGRYRALLEGPTLLCSFGESVSSGTTREPIEQATTKKEATAPVLKNLGVSFEPWDKTTNRAGAFVFLQAENKLFLEYGAEVESPDGKKTLPTFEYRTAKDADVFSTIDGVVTNITYEERTEDYSIHIQPELNSEWVIEHDHVSNLKISKGNTIKAGDILGKAGTLGGQLGRTEIMMWGPGLSKTRINTYCPFKYFDPGLLSEYKQKVTQHMKDWEEFKGNQNLYNEGAHVFPGCAYETLLD